MTDYNYEAAYKGILTPAELAAGEKEAQEYAASLKGVARIPRHVVRLVAPNDAAKEKMVAAGVAKADAVGMDYSAIAAKLNHKTFLLTPAHQLQEIPLSDLSGAMPRKGEPHTAPLFPSGKEKEWPTLVLVSNSNLMSPQSFYDSFRGAEKLVKAVLQGEEGRLVIAGSYFSERHFHANAAETLRRCTELGLAKDQRDPMQEVTTAAELQAYQILDLLLERDAQGHVVMEPGRNIHAHTSVMQRAEAVTKDEDGKAVADGKAFEVEDDVLKPVLRRDAPEVLQHIIAYGYSAAHNTNKDAFRALHDILSRGAVRIYPHLRSNETKDSTAAYADRLMESVRIIGVAGKDSVSAKSRGEPRVINFVSRGDLPMAAEGAALMRHPETEEVKTPRVSKLRRRAEILFGPKPLESTYAGHSQNAYIDALLDTENKNAIGEGWEQLNNRKFRTYHL